MSGGSSSSASTSNTTNQDNRLVVDNGVGVNAQSGASVTVLDGGAIKGAFSFADNVTNAGVKGYDDLLGLTAHTFDSIFKVIEANTATVDHITSTTTAAIQDARNSELKATDNNRFLVAGALAVVGIVAIKVWGK